MGVKKRIGVILAALMIWAAAAIAETDLQCEGNICVEGAAIYVDEAMQVKLADVPHGAAVRYDASAWDSVAAVEAAGQSGYMPRTHIAFPAEEEWQGYDTGAVLCQTLSFREMPDSASARLDVLETGEKFVILAEKNGFYLACRRDESGEKYETGWVNADYVAKNMGTLMTRATVHARAYGDESAPLVGEIKRGTRLNLIARVGEYYVVSLRGASGFIHESQSVELDAQARAALGLEATWDKTL